MAIPEDGKDMVQFDPKTYVPLDNPVVPTVPYDGFWAIVTDWVDYPFYEKRDEYKQDTNPHEIWLFRLYWDNRKQHQDEEAPVRSWIQAPFSCDKLPFIGKITANESEHIKEFRKTHPEWR